MDSDPAMPDGFFRNLTDEEIEEFRQWARDNDTPEHREQATLYHPIVRDEYDKIDAARS